jgi:hypothetical protein
MRRRSGRTLLVAAGGACACALLLAAGGRAQGTDVRPCTPSDYSDPYGVVPIWRNARGADVPAVVVFTGRMDSPCRLVLRIGAEIRSRHHRMSRIAGNPATAHFSIILHRYGQVVHAWAWRNWCGAREHRAVALFTSPITEPLHERVFRLPRCRNPRRRSRLVSLGTSRVDQLLPRFPETSIPAHFPGDDVPQIPSPALIRVQNRWLDGDGRTIVDVYAGERGDNANAGMFVIYRTYNVFGYVSRQRVYVPGMTKAVRITKAPLGKKAEPAALTAVLHWRSKTGVTGTLDLDGGVLSVDGG